jgi:hypothetical protein
MPAGTRIELTDKVAKIMLGEQCVKTVSVEELIHKAIGILGCKPLFPEAIPPTVRWIQTRAEFTCVVTELNAGPRTVKWIADDSPVDYGEGVKYRERRISLPFIVLPLLFQGPKLVDARLYYRTRPITGPLEQAELFRPNLLNVSDVPGSTQRTWFCIQYVDVTNLGWYEKIREVGNHLVLSGFNRSSEHHEHHSYWSDSVKDPPDPRVAGIDAWEAGTREDPNFAVTVNWPSAEVTVAEVVNSLLDAGRARKRLRTVNDLVDLAAQCRPIGNGEGLS